MNCVFAGLLPLRLGRNEKAHLLSMVVEVGARSKQLLSAAVAVAASRLRRQGRHWGRCRRVCRRTSGCSCPPLPKPKQRRHSLRVVRQQRQGCSRGSGRVPGFRHPLMQYPAAQHLAWQQWPLLRALLWRAGHLRGLAHAAARCCRHSVLASTPRRRSRRRRGSSRAQLAPCWRPARCWRWRGCGARRCGASRQDLPPRVRQRSLVRRRRLRRRAVACSTQACGQLFWQGTTGACQVDVAFCQSPVGTSGRWDRACMVVFAVPNWAPFEFHDFWVDGWVRIWCTRTLT